MATAASVQMAFVNLGALLRTPVPPSACSFPSSSPSEARLVRRRLLNMQRPFATRTDLDGIGGGGGIRPGVVLELYGRPHSGKTTIALSAAVEALAENFGRTIRRAAIREVRERSGGASPAATGADDGEDTADPSSVAVSTRVVWVSSAPHRPFSPALLLTALEDSAVEALEAFYEGAERSSAADGGHEHTVRPRGDDAAASDDDDDDAPFDFPFTDFSTPLLQDPSLLARAVADAAFHFYGGVATPHALVSLCEGLASFGAGGGCLFCSNNNSNSPPFVKVEGHSAPISPQPPGNCCRFNAKPAVPPSERVLFVFDCFAVVLSSIEAAPLLAAVASATAGGLSLGEKDTTAAFSTEGSGSGSTNRTSNGGGGGGAGQAYQFTAHEIKKALARLIAARTYGGSPSAVCTLLTNIATTAGSVGGGGGTSAVSASASGAPPPPRPIGGAVWSTVASARVHVALEEEEVAPLVGADGDARAGVVADTAWRHIFTVV